ncbi:MAG TPA: hypothetical protein DEF12_16150 [Rhodobacteraceae bacterium]|jgi:hypothetical protein|nr:hypothetical protein [Paracoccaceae bacterium]HBV56552.1 hypothetical protein [Paracoccaceae bacterium]
MNLLLSRRGPNCAGNFVHSRETDAPKRGTLEDKTMANTPNQPQQPTSQQQGQQSDAPKQPVFRDWASI